jgi:hypothetical protein
MAPFILEYLELIYMNLKTMNEMQNFILSFKINYCISLTKLSFKDDQSVNSLFDHYHIRTINGFKLVNRNRIQHISQP